MLTCPHCRFLMDDAPDLAGQLVACPRCAGQMMMPGFAPAPQPATVIHHHYHGKRGKDKAAGMVAALMSFLIPGLGQLCQGRAAMGVLLCFGTLLAVAIGFALPPFLLVAICFWLWAIMDAAWH